MKWIASVAGLGWLFMQSPRAVDLRVAVSPARPFIEQRGKEQRVNFDLLVQNGSTVSYDLIAIRVSVFDRAGRLELKRELNENGRPPALNVVGDRQLRPGGVIDVYQPFYEFGPEIELGRMHLECLFNETGHVAPSVPLSADATVSVDVAPQDYAPDAFLPPLRGLVVVQDGHDYFSHHRRYNLAARFRADPLSAVSANLYAYDFMETTPAGALFEKSPAAKENWFSYGQAIFAPEGGKVITAVSDVEENTFETTFDGGSGAGVTTQAKVPAVMEAKDPNGFGNYVELKHPDGRVSWLLHMQPHSATVHAGEQVVAGQLLGKVGFSGDSLFPHLHYNVTRGAAYPSQGVPTYFRNFIRVLGSRRVPVSRGELDSGDLFRESAALFRSR